ncbi:MAG: cupin domain-containing protein [Acidobacteriaceae bacterium]
MSQIAQLKAGITKAGEGIDGIVWNVLGSKVVPLEVSEDSFAWINHFPPGTGIPPHFHRTQDEFIYVLEGRMNCQLDGVEQQASAGDLIRMPRNIPHAVFNKSDAQSSSLWWVSPTGKFWDLFTKINNVPDAAEVVRLAELHDIHFLPPNG